MVEDVKSWGDGLNIEHLSSGSVMTQPALRLKLVLFGFPNSLIQITT